MIDIYPLVFFILDTEEWTTHVKLGNLKTTSKVAFLTKYSHKILWHFILIDVLGKKFRQDLFVELTKEGTIK